MTQASVEDWCVRVQARLMAAIDAAWAIIDASDDPAEVRRARDKAKACGELAAMARKVAGMTPRPAAKPGLERLAAAGADRGAPATPNRPPRPLRGGSRGRL